MNQSWPKQNRITRRADYVACYDGGVRYFTRHFVVFVHDRDQRPSSRVGLAVTRKSGNAVQRNRIKRVLREFFRLHRPLLPCRDVVVTPKRHLRAEDIHLGMVQREMIPLLKRLAQEADNQLQPETALDNLEFRTTADGR